MKRFVLFVLLSLAVHLPVLAQDVITKADGSKVEAKVVEITESVIKYHRADNLSGPIYTVPLTSVLNIRFENGTVQNFTGNPATAPATESLVMQQGNSLSDAELLKLMDFPSFDKYKSRAKKLKWTGIIGGGALILAGGILGAVGGFDFDGGGTYTPLAVIGVSMMGVSVLWGGSFLYASHYYNKKAKSLEMNSFSLVEGDLFESKGVRLSAGVNVLAAEQLKNSGLGLGLKLSF